MAAKYKEVKKVVKTKNEEGEEVQEVKVTKYRIDADFKPSKPSDIVIDYIENYCVANNQIDWLVKEVSKTVTDKNGKKGKIGFVSVRADFVKEFMPEISAPKPAPKKSFHDILLEKYGK